MKLFTLAVGNDGEIKFTGDSPQEAKRFIEMILQQQAFQAGMQTEKQKIRQGYKTKRHKTPKESKSEGVRP